MQMFAQGILFTAAGLALLSCRNSADIASGNSASKPRAAPLVGVWQEVEIVVTGAKPSSNAHPQPGVRGGCAAMPSVLGPNEDLGGNSRS